MLVNFNVAGDLSGLLLAYMDQQNIDLPDLRAQLKGYHANSRMPFTDWWDALETLAVYCNKPAVGLEIGCCIQPGHCGLIGYLSLSCDTLGEALVKFERYQRLLYEGNQAGAHSDGELMTFSWPYDYGYSTKESDETLISSLATFIRMLVEDDQLSPLKVGFVHKQPEDLSPYKELLRCDLEFESENTYVTFPISFLQRKIVKADPVLAGLLDQQAANLMEGLPDHDLFEQEFYRHLLRAMQDGNPTIEAVAKSMATSARTLHRRLEERGGKFKERLTGTREQLALQYLKEKHLTHAEIALLLGYSEQSAFSRAFKQWTGKTPLMFQKEVSNG